MPGRRRGGEVRHEPAPVVDDRTAIERVQDRAAQGQTLPPPVEPRPQMTPKQIADEHWQAGLAEEGHSKEQKQRAAEQKRLDKMMREQAKKDAAAAEKAKKEAAKRAEAQRKLAEKQAKEQARRDAEVAKAQAKADKARADAQAANNSQALEQPSPAQLAR